MRAGRNSRGRGYAEYVADYEVEGGVEFRHCLAFPFVARAEEGEEAVDVEFKEGGASVGAFERHTVDVPPLSVGRHADVGPSRARCGFRFGYRYGERHPSPGIGYVEAMDAFLPFVEAHAVVCHGVAVARRHGIVAHRAA